MLCWKFSLFYKYRLENSQFNQKESIIRSINKKNADDFVQKLKKKM